MNDTPKALKDKIKRYSLLVAWWHIHEGNKSVENKFEEVLKKIEQTEDELRVSGVSQETLDNILKKAKHFVNLTIGEMSSVQLDTMIKLIFGQNVKTEKFDKKELESPWVKHINPIEYAKKKEEIKYVTYEHKKELWMGSKISIRNYIVEDAIKNNSGIRIKHEGKIMSLSPEQLKNEGFHNKEKFYTAKTSGYGISAGYKYYLIDYTFKPD